MVYQYSEPNVMHFLFRLLKIKGLDMFRALLTHSQEVLYKRDLRACYASWLHPWCLEARIIAAMKNIDASMLTRVWQELEYRIDVCRVTRSAHIEHPKLSKNLFQFFCGCE
jgi:hypothetical protein